MSKTLVLLAALVVIAIATGALAVASFLRERKGARALRSGPDSAAASGPRYPPQLDR
jgi:hypothetical protein